MARFASSILLLLSLLITGSQALAHLSRYFSFVGYEDKGPLGYVFSNPDSDPSLFRLYKMPNWHTRECMFTADPDERQRLLDDSAAGWGDELYTENPAWKGVWVYRDEGPAADRVPLYRMRLTTTNQHLWTVDQAETVSLKTQGWIYEGIACYFPNPDSQPAGADMLYRYAWTPPAWSVSSP
ncbi:hypothetical protein MMC07_008476 [Pseudocyphellaria aurata]|nr:hypothetical protein [Pseudocyphellaria aurata]